MGDGAASRTRIMYNPNLSHDQMKHYLTILTENYFLYYNLHTQRLKTKGKGLKVIEAYKWIEDMIRSQQISPAPLRKRQVQSRGLIEITG